MTPVAASSPSINGVLLLTKDGRPKSRYSDDERLRVLRGTQDDLNALIELFCPSRPLYSCTRGKSDDPRDWTTPRGRLSERAILNHLVGNLLPGRYPRWIAPRSWEVTWWVGIDVDLRNGNVGDFQRRCSWIRRKLRLLGIRGKHLLVSTTPSGGKHFRFFSTKKIKVKEIERVFSLVGIEEKSGKIELFPREKKGMRLPFGYIPGERFDPSRWLTFIRRYRSKQFPRVNWRGVVKRAERTAAQHGIIQERLPSEDNAVAKIKYENPSTPRKHYKFRVPPASRRTARQAEFRELIDLPTVKFSVQAAERLWELGIQTVGTRVDATKKLAWHFCNVQRLPQSETEAKLIDWVYRTGSRTSQDVQKDLTKSSRDVAKQTRKIIEWIYAHPPTHERNLPSCFALTRAEKEHFKEQLAKNFVDDHPQLLDFLCHFLRYAKKHGVPTESGWNVYVTAAKVMRKWPGCSGSGYKVRRDILERMGLIVPIEKEWKTRTKQGRSRRYFLACSPDLARQADQPTKQTGTFQPQRGKQESISSHDLQSVSLNNDSYRRRDERTSQRRSVMEVEQREKYVVQTHTGHRVASTVFRSEWESSETTLTIHGSPCSSLYEEYRRAQRMALGVEKLNSVAASKRTCPKAVPDYGEVDVERLKKTHLSQKAQDYFQARGKRPVQTGLPRWVQQEMAKAGVSLWNGDPP